MTTPDRLRSLLCDLGNHIQSRILAVRQAQVGTELSAIAAITASDTIYAIDRVSEEAIAEWFAVAWPSDEPVQVVMEGLPDDEPLCFPRGTPVTATNWKCLLDPIDGTRCIMHDKRSAWVLAGIAPQRGTDNRLSDIIAASMTELPTTRQWRADQVSAVRGGGIVSTATNVLDGSTFPITLRASQATGFAHGFCWMTKYFPQGRTLISQIEEALWEELAAPSTTPLHVFDDQYISTGGAFYELLSGRDRFIGDIRPLVYSRLGLDESLSCHPYDVAAAMLLAEAGIIYESPLGGFPDAPMDTTTPIAWIACANSHLAGKVVPALRKILTDLLG